MDTLLYSCAQIRAIEHAAQARLPPAADGARGPGGGRFALELLDGEAAGAVLVLAGPGNNGGDGARAGRQPGARGRGRRGAAPGRRAAPSSEAARALQRARDAGARFVDEIPAGRDWRLVVDALFGIGLARPLAGRARELAAWTARLDCPVLALDVPSGLDADTGAVIGPDGVAVRPRTPSPSSATSRACIRATAATTPATCVDMLGADGLHQEAGAGRLNGPSLFAEHLAPRRRNSHKGSFGDVVVLGGARGMAGAAVLAARAALFGGAGRVFAAMLDGGMALDPLQPEIMFRDAAGIDFAGRSVVAGPGHGRRGCRDPPVRQGARRARAAGGRCRRAEPARPRPELQERWPAHGAGTVLTPHPLEAARLLGRHRAHRAGRPPGARARSWRCASTAVVVLKGAGSVIARPDGFVAVNTSGNPGLATGGSGDVLAGFCGALLAQGWPAWEAALGAVWMHGAAADWLVEEGAGPIGLTAASCPGDARLFQRAACRMDGHTTRGNVAPGGRPQS
jgi:NAD(P)H-hydrate repair Nnr-like enzyme with NAD(P)H-hydrate dehydratase domain/NAD(P)H-hydrate repair Nnr-like enzyme with NAD(P)H-hydrate epimerase domain